MPIAMIHLAEGRSEEKKHALLVSVTQAIAHSLEVPLDSVRVLLQEIPDTQWAAGGKTLAERRRGNA